MTGVASSAWPTAPRWGDGDGEVRRRARERLAEAEARLRRLDPAWSPPPYDPLLVAQALGIRCVEVAAPFCGALICVRDGQPVILYRRQRDEGRTRFALFHEIAHTLFPDCGRAAMGGAGSPLLAPEGRLERLCDTAALELMMPRDRFDADLAAAGFGAGRVGEMCRRYGAATEAVAVRMVESQCAPACALALVEHDRPTRWRRRQEDGDDGEYALTWAGYSERWRARADSGPGGALFLARRLALPRGSCLRAAARSGKPGSGREVLPILGGPPRAFRVEALPLDDRPRRKGHRAVLTFIYPV